MKCLLISLALWLGTVGTRGTEPELSETQRRSLQVALEEFHKHPPVQLAAQSLGELESGADPQRYPDIQSHRHHVQSW